MDLKALGAGNRSASQLSTNSRNSSIESGGSKAARSSSKNRFTRLLPTSRRRSIKESEEAAAATYGAEKWTHPDLEHMNGGDLGLLDNGSDSLITLADEDEDEDRYVQIS
jgi:hypothetical protein